MRKIKNSHGEKRKTSGEKNTRRLDPVVYVLLTGVMVLIFSVVMHISHGERIMDSSSAAKGDESENMALHESEELSLEISESHAYKRIENAKNASYVPISIKKSFVAWISASEGFLDFYGSEDWCWEFKDIDEPLVTLCCYGPEDSSGNVEYLTLVYENGIVTQGVLELGSIPSENIDKEIVRFAFSHSSTASTAIRDIVSQFNESSTSCYVELVDVYSTVYAKSTDTLGIIGNWEYALDKYGDIDLLNIGYLYSTALASRGYLADINRVVDCSDILPNLWEALSVCGENYVLPSGFYLSTLVGKSEIIGDENNLSVKDFLAMDDGTIPLLGGYDSEIYLRMLALEMPSTFMDIRNNTYNFTSDDFIQMLNYANTIPDTVAVGVDSMTQFRNNKRQLIGYSLYNFDDMHQLETCYLDAELTFTGWPLQNGGAFELLAGAAVTTSGAESDGVKAFIQYMLSSEVQQNCDVFSITQSGLLRQAGIVMNNNDGTFTMTGSNECTIDEITYTYSPMTEEQLQKYMAILEGISIIRVADSSISTIITEEGTSMLEGIQVAEVAAKNIQVRVSEYLHEVLYGR